MGKGDRHTDGSPPGLRHGGPGVSPDGRRSRLPPPSSVTVRPATSTHALLGLSPTAEPGHWTVDVHDGVQTGSGALHGGSAFGAAVEAMAMDTGRPAAWVTAQFVAHARAGDTLDLWVDEIARGHRVTQARARLERDGHEVLSAMGAFGSRSFDVEHTWARALDVPRPEMSSPRPGGREPLIDLWQSRIAVGRAPGELDGRPGSGRSASWYRLPDGCRSVTAGDLAVLGDFTMLELHDALGGVFTGNSLDNTLRVGADDETEWILVDTQVSMVARGFAVVTAHLWSESGSLLGVASQTLVPRHVDADGRPLRTDKRFAGA